MNDPIDIQGCVGQPGTSKDKVPGWLRRHLPRMAGAVPPLLGLRR